MSDEVVLYLDKLVANWFGPYAVRNYDGKIFSLGTDDLLIRSSVDKVKLYRSMDSETLTANEHNASTMDPMNYNIDEANALASFFCHQFMTPMHLVAFSYTI